MALALCALADRCGRRAMFRLPTGSYLVFFRDLSAILAVEAAGDGGRRAVPGGTGDGLPDDLEPGRRGGARR